MSFVCRVQVARPVEYLGGEARTQNRTGKGSAVAPPAFALHACNILFTVGLQVSSPKTEPSKEDMGNEMWGWLKNLKIQ